MFTPGDQLPRCLRSLLCLTCSGSGIHYRFGYNRSLLSTCRITIFNGDLYKFPPFALLLLFIGNFLGEELYFRGYLMKKIAFLGNAAWVVNSLLFATYHFWQIPQTWPLVDLVLTIGLLMQLRKDLYVLVAFHFFIDMWLTYGDYPLARFLHLAK